MLGRTLQLSSSIGTPELLCSLTAAIPDPTAAIPDPTADGPLSAARLRLDLLPVQRQPLPLRMHRGRQQAAMLPAALATTTSATWAANPGAHTALRFAHHTTNTTKELARYTT